MVAQNDETLAGESVRRERPRVVVTFADLADYAALVFAFAVLVSMLAAE